MVEATRAEAVRLIEKDTELTKHPLLNQKARQKTDEFYFD